MFDRKSSRLSKYDYTQPGMYFVTICTKDRQCLFGSITNGIMYLNQFGMIAEQEWLQTMMIRPNVFLDKYVMMPDHVHAIIEIIRRGVMHYAPTQTGFNSPSQTVGAIVRGYKSAVTKRINQIRHSPGQSIWQRGFYDHIIRNDEDLGRVREYIRLNPVNWERDEFNQ